MNIPDRAVEAAARDLYETEPLALVNEATETMTAKPWEWLSENFRAHKMQQARATLEAAAPYIVAQGLRDAATLVDAEGSEVDWEETTEGAGRRHAADEIEALADELDPQ